MIYHPFRHLGLKIFSVAIAALLWLSVSGEQIVERSLRVPLELQNSPENLELVDIPPPTVDVRVRGSSGLLSHLSSGDIVAVLDMSSARPGRRFFALTPDRVQGPSGVEIGQVSPSTITLDFERSVTRSVRVSPPIEGQPAAGYEVQSIACQPETVEVVGPETVLRQLTRVVTEPVSVAGATRSVREAVTMGVAAPGLRLKTPGRATVTVTIGPVPVERTLQGVPVRFLHAPARGGAQATPATVAVSVKGPRESIDGLSSGALAASVDLAGHPPGRYNLQVRVTPPERVEIVRVEPPSVAVRIK